MDSTSARLKCTIHGNKTQRMYKFSEYCEIHSVRAGLANKRV